MLTLYILNRKKIKGDDYRYGYITMINSEKIAEGKVLHTRKEGWAVLVKKIAEQHLSTNAESSQ